MSFKLLRYPLIVVGLIFVVASSFGCTATGEVNRIEKQDSGMATNRCRLAIRSWNKFRDSFLNLVYWSGPPGSSLSLYSGSLFDGHNPSANFYEREDLRQDWFSVYLDLKDESFQGHLPLNQLNSKMQSYYLNIETLMIGTSANDYDYPTVDLINRFIESFNPLVESSNTYCRQFGFSKDG